MQFQDFQLKKAVHKHFKRLYYTEQHDRPLWNLVLLFLKRALYYKVYGMHKKLDIAIRVTPR